jgi:tetratricopeptide (TPR) repeat protein
VRRHDDIPSDDATCDHLFLIWRDLARSHVALYAPFDGKWQLEQAVGWARAGAAAMAHIGSKQGESLALFILGKAWLFVGAYEEAEAALQKSVQRAVQAGNDVVREFSTLLLSRLALHREQADEALAYLDGKPTNDRNIAHGQQCVRAEASYLRADHQRALSIAVPCAGGSGSPSRRMAWATVARSYYALGRDTEALEAVGQAFQQGDAAPDLEFELDLRNTRVLAFVRRGDVEAARAELRFARDLLRRVAAPIADPRLRTLFLDAIASHRRHAELAREWLPA